MQFLSRLFFFFQVVVGASEIHSYVTRRFLFLAGGWLLPGKAFFFVAVW